ncbi:MAG TPA: hypothetical protein VHC43_10025 [Mycobacteriales bacterium]|nr:hypothetical protein [Mycobacteriales bacterium]
MKRTPNPALPSLLVFGGLVVAGFVVMAVAWRIAARTLDVSIQVPAVISGGVGGLVLIVVGTGLFVSQLGRLRAADERADMDEMLDRTSQIVGELRSAREAR